MEKTLIHKTFLGKPYKVYEYNDVHYFFWPIELGVGKVKIKNLVIPYFPKILDYEPVKVVNFQDSNVVLSRFHYHIITYFNKPLLNDSKPIIDFSFGSHTPLAITDLSTKTHHGCDRHFPAGIDSREIDAFIILLAIFDSIMTNGMNFKIEEVTSYDLSNEQVVHEKYLFEPKDMFAIIWLGKFPSPEELKHIGYTLLDLE